MRRARALRRRQTRAERVLWHELRNGRLGVKFYRQRPIDRYIADFYCPSHQLVVEVDGGIHRVPRQKRRDRQRDAQLHSLGVRVLRVMNDEVLGQCERCLEKIRAALG